MSDDEYHEMNGSDEEFNYEDEHDEEDFDDAFFQDPHEVALPTPAVQPRRHHQPPPAPLPPPIIHQNPLGRYINPAAFQAGFGGHAFARPPASAFRRSYRAFSTAILEVQQGRSGNFGDRAGRSNLMFGGKIVMPPSALDELTQLDIDFPVTFEITNPSNPELNTHVGVLEFIAEEGTVNLPQWIMDQLRLDEGDPVRIWGGRYPKGKLVKIQPQSVDFLEISDPKAVLESVMRNFSCLSAGDIIEIGYGSQSFRILIMEITPPGPAISVIDTDLEVDFAPPLGYIEPERSSKSHLISGPSMRDKFTIDTKRKQDVDARGSGANTPVLGGSGSNTPSGGAAKGVFAGTGRSLAGKRIKGKGLAKKIEDVDSESKIIRTDQPRIITADTQIGGRQVPAALNLPFGNLFFGFDNLRPPPGSAAEKENEAAAAAAAAAPFAGVGQGNTLSGRARTMAAAPGGTPQAARAPAPAPAAGEKKTGFGGSGQTLSGKKPIEVIEID